MSRFCWSLVTCGLTVVTWAGSFEAACAKDKDPPPPARGQPAAGVPPNQVAPVAPRQVAPVAPNPVQPLPPNRIAPVAPRQVAPALPNPVQSFQPNKTNNNVQGGNPPRASAVPGNVGGSQNGGGAIPSHGTVPQGTFGRTQGGDNPGLRTSGGTSNFGGQKFETAKPSIGFGPSGAVTNAPAGTFGSAVPNALNKPRISVEQGAGKQTFSGQSGRLPFDPKGTVKLNPQPEPPGQPRVNPRGKLTLDRPLGSFDGHEKTKPLTVFKNGRPLPDLPRGGTLPLGGTVGRVIGADQHRGTPQDDKLHSLLQAKNRDDLSRELKAFKVAENESPRPQDRLALKHLNLDTISGVHQERLANPANFQDWQQSKIGQKLGLQQQFALQSQGDLSRRLNLNSNLINAGGWAQHRQHGVIAASFTSAAFSGWYAGGGCYPSHCWCPTWSPWVDWSYWGTCPVFYDPRPYFCIPVVYGPCVPWVYYDYPVWNPLPVVACGTWIDVSPVVVTTGLDLQLLAVRFVDNGHPTQNLGPRYRVWVRNNSPVQIVTPFSVLMLASNEQTPTVELPQMGVVVPSMDIGETQVLDIRLPLAANRLGVTPEGYRVPFTYLHVLVDSHQQIPETFEDNNGAVLLRTDILPVDPAAFSTDLTAAAPESLLTIAGEGFGPEPGQVIVSVYGQQVQAEIHGWYDLGIQFAVPNFALTRPVDAEVLVVRGDSAVSNPLTVRLAPQELLEEAAALPESPIPAPPQ